MRNDNHPIITLAKNNSLKINFENKCLNVNETEELSFVFIQKLLEHSNKMSVFEIEFPFDMIEFFFRYRANEKILIGWRMYDHSEQEEMEIETIPFFESLITALENYFKTLELETTLDHYIIDNNPIRNRNKKWNWNMVQVLRNNYLK